MWHLYIEVENLSIVIYVDTTTKRGTQRNKKWNKYHSEYLVVEN